MAQQQQRVALITGVSSGIGKSSAVALLTSGFRVFGTSRRAEPGSSTDGVEMIRLDVTDDASVNAAVAEVLQRAGQIDVLVNNAGVGIIGGAEESSIEQAKALFDTNFFGVIRVIRAVVPHMRLRKSGRIINISSVLGFLPAPYMAIYAASKHAVEGYSESLDHELRTSGIRVALVEPAYTRTSFDQNMVGPDAALSEYEGARKHMAALLVETTAAADNPEVVADTVVRAASDIKPKMRYPAGAVARKVTFLRRFAPISLVDGGVRKQMRLDA